MPLRYLARFASKEICRPQNIAKAGDRVCQRDALQDWAKARGQPMSKV
jgi:hypothetical protein